MKNKFLNQKGQSLIEVLIALSISVIVAVAFTNVTITSVRNAQLAKNQNLSTKFAQQTIEYIRAIRDQDRIVNYPAIGNTWSALWLANLGSSGQCFSLDKANIRLTLSSCSTDTVITDKAGTNTVFMRQIKITDDGAILDKKTIYVEVYWNDSKGKHSAKISTYLTKWQ
ncbi:MAG: prepilin-type N-terminal cleavage/methylation domain-containing protein [bacterium]|nr:prepilin-type N-terminal cleavage/methylation domain-containing protein [bacterium]